ncbi:hypothetical protein JST97_18065 [bacterium]|nr:hypothetical protein [bacterium]
MEVLVVTGLMTTISAFTMVLYTSAMGDFESANSKYTMSMYARRASSRIENILSTAASRRPGTSVAEAFYSPLPNDSTEYPSVDFITASNFIKASATECAYAFDDGGATPGYTPLFRYRLAWTPTAIGTIPAKSVYLERLQLDPLAPTPMAGVARQVLCPNIGRCGFMRMPTGTIQVRILVYAFDPATGRGIDGTTNRLQSHRRRRDATSTGTRTDEKSFELLSSVPLPTLNIK